MSNSARFAQLVQSAYMNDDKASMIDAYYQWQDTNCLYPVSVRVRDSHTQTMRKIQVPCGSCWHCQQSKINEWCTRMYAHAEDFKHVYFVTLTYRSVTNIDNKVNELFLEKLGQAVWHQDNRNSTRHLCYRPCVLVKKHYQDFLKRLRKNTGLTDLTYVVSGEYGHDFGAPHFHFVFFTNGILTRDDIVRAWSVCLWKDTEGKWSYRRNQRFSGHAYDFPIGRVDFNDLVSNGTMNKNFAIRIDGNYMNAANCFAYVCKYVVKRDSYNNTRVRIAYNNLFHKEKVVKIGTDEVQFYNIRKYLIMGNFIYSENTIDNLKSLSYEKIVYEPSETISQYGLLRFKRTEKQNFTYDVDLLPEVRYEFYNLFRPFCEFSRGCPIGSLYAKRNVQEFAQGIYSKPLLQDKGFIVPRYFRSKAQDYLYGLRKLHKTIKSDSLVLTGLVNLRGRLQSALHDPLSLHENLGNKVSDSIVSQTLQEGSRLFVDAFTKERIIIYDDFARHYRYSRHTRSYELTRSIRLADWIRDWSLRLQDELQRAKIQRERSAVSCALHERASLMLLDQGIESSQLRESYVVRQNLIQRDSDVLYHSTHASAE